MHILKCALQLKFIDNVHNYIRKIYEQQKTNNTTFNLFMYFFTIFIVNFRFSCFCLNFDCVARTLLYENNEPVSVSDIYLYMTISLITAVCVTPYNLTCIRYLHNVLQSFHAFTLSMVCSIIYNTFLLFENLTENFVEVILCSLLCNKMFF